MIGNDIVDLVQAKQESNWQRKGFLNKLFTDEEQQLIYSASDSERMVWVIWSMKESAYKASLRETGKRRFAPKKLACQLTSIHEETTEGTVFYEKIYQTKSVLTQHYVTSIAYPTSSSSNVQQLIIPFTSATYQNQSSTIRKKIIQHCAEILSISEESVCLEKDQNGIPELLISDPINGIQTIPISISHHGYYGAYVLMFSSFEAYWSVNSIVKQNG